MTRIVTITLCLCSTLLTIKTVVGERNLQFITQVYEVQIIAIFAYVDIYYLETTFHLLLSPNFQLKHMHYFFTECLRLYFGLL